MRIALYTEVFLPKVDGIVNTLCYLLNHLEKRGHESIIFTPSPAPERYANTTVYTCPAFPLPFYPELRIALPYWQMRKQLNTFSPDIIHVANPLLLGNAGMKHASELGIPIAAAYHTDIPGFMTKWGLNRFVPATWKTLRWLHNKADLNLCPSRETMRQLNEKGFSNLKLWSRGVDTNLFTPTQRSKEWRYHLTQGNPEAPLILFVSRLSPEKRADWLRPILETYPKAHLAIVGDGPARNHLEALFVGTNTTFTGYLKGADLARVYASADVFAFPSANETFGNVVLEAMSSGLPIVAARSGGPLDTVEHGINGLFFDPNDPSELIGCVGQLIKDQSYAKSVGQNGRKTAETRSWIAVLDGLLTDYEQLIAKRKKQVQISSPRETKAKQTGVPRLEN